MEDDILHHLWARAMSLDAATRGGIAESSERPDEPLNEEFIATFQEASPKITTPSTKQRQAKPDSLRRSSSASKLTNEEPRPSSSHRASSTRNLFSHQKSSPATPSSRRRGSMKTSTSRPRSKSPIDRVVRPVLESSRRPGSSRNLRPRSKSPSPANNASARPRRQGSQRNIHSRPRSKSPVETLPSLSSHQSGRHQGQGQRGSRSKSPPPISSSKHQSGRRAAKQRPRSKSPTDPSASPRHQSGRRVARPRSRSKSPAADPLSSPRQRASRRSSATATTRSRSGSSGGSESRPASHRSLQVQPVPESRRKNSSAMSPKSARSENPRATRRSSRAEASRTPAGSDVSASKSPSSRNMNENENSEMPSFPRLMDDAPSHRSSYPYIQSMSGTITSENLEEDDDIIDDEDEHSLAVARFRRQNGLPPDPSSASNEVLESVVPRSGNDRFNATFNNHETWMGGEELETNDIHLGRLPSPENFEMNATSKDQTNESQKTPKTPKTNNMHMRSSGKRPSQIELPPSIDSDPSGQSRNDAKNFPIYEEEAAMGPGQKQKNTLRKKKAASDFGVSPVTISGRSSSQGFSKKGRESDDSHDDDDGYQPSIVPTLLSPSGTSMSPMTTSINSTPNSRLSSSRSRQRKNSLQDLLRFHSSTASKRRNSIGLDAHFGKDEISVGASTITTNFTSTQRDRDDATVSERSLFQPTSTINPSQMPRIPQRRTATFDDHESDREDCTVDSVEPVFESNFRSG